MQYADYEYYASEFSGSTIPEEAFDRFAKHASAFIDNVTFGRAITACDRYEVKSACCAVAEEIYNNEQNGGVLQSESSGSYSRTFKIEDGFTAVTAMYNAAYLYLANTGLMYRGW